MAPTTTTDTHAPPRLARTDIDWSRLYREGLRVRVGPGEGAEASGFVVPCAADEDLLVLLIPCRRGITGHVRELLLQTAALARHGHGLWTWLQSLGKAVQ